MTGNLVKKGISKTKWQGIKQKRGASFPRPPINAKEATEVMRFLREPVPPFAAPEGKRWKQRAAKLPFHAARTLLNVVRFKRPYMQYSALLALRELRYQVWAEGQGETIRYNITTPTGRLIRISPRMVEAEETYHFPPK